MAKRKLVCAAAFAWTIVSVVLWLPRPTASRLALGQLNQTPLEIVDGHEAAAGRVIVKYRETADKTSAAQYLPPTLDADSDVELGGTGARLIHSRTLSTADLISQLASREDVLYAEPDYVAYGGAVPNDSFYGAQQWALHNSGQTIGGQSGTPGADISAPQAWDISTGAASQVVAINDTGIDYNHPDLAPNVWSAPSAFSVTISGTTINCPAGTHGINTITNTCDPLDDHNHGSNVSGIIGAAGNNGQGVTGINWQAKLLGIKWLNSNNSGFISDAIDALEVAVQLKQAGLADIRVSNNSWFAGASSQSLLDEIRRTEANGILFVAIAGNGTANDGFTKGGHDNDNGSTPTYPSNYNEPGMISVVATDNRDALAFFSNWGKQTVHVGAPGNVIFATLRNGTYGTFSGTSQAAPHVTGSAALLLSRCNLTAAGLKGVLITTTDADSALTDKTTSGGRLNLWRALSACVASPAIIDDTKFYVRQQYVDFLSREPDTGGFQFWSQGIDVCGGDAQCRAVKRIDTSAAFFLSIEFQDTGYLVYKMYKAGFGNLAGKPVAVDRTNFLNDTRQIQTTPAQVIVGQGNWQAQLETNKQAFALAFVQRSAFQSAHGSQDATTFVNSLFASAGVSPTPAETTAAISAFSGAGGGDAGRAGALRSVAESNSVSAKLFNEAFVLMQYFGYLQRNPYDPPEPTLDYQGYNFWLNKLNSFGGNYVNAEMVKAFISSTEYRQRFGS